MLHARDAAMRAAFRIACDNSIPSTFYHNGYDAPSTPEERISRVRALYERPGSAGEKAAAAEALRRLGVDPTSFSRPQAQAKPTGKFYLVQIFNSEGRRVSDIGVRAADRNDALAKATRQFESTTGRQASGFRFEVKEG